MPATVWLLLAALPILCAWLPGRGREAVACATAALLVMFGVWHGVLRPPALPALLGLYGCAWWAGRSSLPWRPLGRALFALLALAIALGVLPGFARIELSALAPLKPNSPPYALTLNPGKALVAAALLLWLVPLARNTADWRASARTLPVIGLTVAVAPLLGWAIDYIHPQVGLPDARLSLAWAALNLLVVCTLEEGFFRGLVQRGLTFRLPVWAAVGISALLFGLAHLAGGWQLMLLATLAGVGYGLAYQRSGQRLEAAIAGHFAVNVGHFALFTYPTG